MKLVTADTTNSPKFCVGFFFEKMESADIATEQRICELDKEKRRFRD